MQGLFCLLPSLTANRNALIISHISVENVYHLFLFLYFSSVIRPFLFYPYFYSQTCSIRIKCDISTIQQMDFETIKIGNSEITFFCTKWFYAPRNICTRRNNLCEKNRPHNTIFVQGRNGRHIIQDKEMHDLYLCGSRRNQALFYIWVRSVFIYHILGALL